jgi:hypothetical protein
MHRNCISDHRFGFQWILASFLAAGLLLPETAGAKTPESPPIIRVRASQALPKKPLAPGKSRATRLNKITVTGNRIPVPIALELLREALSRPWETAMKDQNQMVCRFSSSLSTRVLNHAGVWCETNEEFFLAQDTGMIPVEIAEDQPEGLAINPNHLRRLFAKLPPPGTSYTLEVTHHGRIVSEWFIHKGHLVKALHFGKHGPRPSESGQ